jgi:hypothetical protein
MANEDELRLRIIADTTEFERQMAELGKLSDTVTAGGGRSGGGGGRGPDPLKEKLDGLRAEIDLTDLSLRKTLTASQRKEQAIRQEASLGKLTQQQMIAGIQAEQQSRENATASAIANFNLIEAELAQLDQSQQAVINRQKQLFFASERAKNGFTTMSGSMTELVSNTKMANITFANFGRIVQDAPFGLLGISNNIDPLLNSFRMLRAEVGGTGAALRAMGAQLLGPAGLIFLLGSALPTALLFIQRGMQKTQKDTQNATDSVNVMSNAIRSELSNAIRGLKFADTAEEIRAIEGALQQVGGSLMVLQPAALNFNRFVTASADATGVTAQNLDAQTTALASITSGQRDLDPLVRKELEQRLASLRASKLIEEELRKIGLAQREINELSIEARKEAERRLRVENESLYIMRLRATSINDMLDDSSAFSDFEANTTAIAGTTEETYRNLALQRIRFERQFADSSLLIQSERDNELKHLASKRFSLGLQDEEAYQQQRNLIIDEYNAQEIEFSRMVAMEKAEQMSIYGDAVSAGLGAIFGEGKAVQSAQTVIDTLTGANKAFTGLMPNFPLAVAAAAAVVAQGVSTLRKINSTDKNTKTISASNPSAPKLSSLPFVTDRSFLATPLASSVASTMLPSNVMPINVEASIDSSGLALAVRRGEGLIASRQIPFAS